MHGMDHSRAPVTHSVWICLGSAGARIPRTWALAKTPIRSTKDDLVMDHITPAPHAMRISPSFIMNFNHHCLLGKEGLKPWVVPSRMVGNAGQGHIPESLPRPRWVGGSTGNTCKHTTKTRYIANWDYIHGQSTHASTRPCIALYAAAFHTETHTHKLF